MRPESIAAGVLALFHRWCQDVGHSPDALHSEAYQEETPDWPETLSRAEWEGVAYPAHWGKDEVAGLLESLHAVNYHSLAGSVSDITGV